MIMTQMNNNIIESIHDDIIIELNTTNDLNFDLYKYKFNNVFNNNKISKLIFYYKNISYIIKNINN